MAISQCGQWRICYDISAVRNIHRRGLICKKLWSIFTHNTMDDTLYNLNYAKQINCCTLISLNEIFTMLFKFSQLY